MVTRLVTGTFPLRHGACAPDRVLTRDDLTKRARLLPRGAIRPCRAVTSTCGKVVCNLDNRFPVSPAVLACGDTLMLLATDLSSDRVPIGEQLPLTSALLLCWGLAGLARGDYRGSDPKEFTYTSVADALIRTAFTWVLFGVFACVACAVASCSSAMLTTVLSPDAVSGEPAPVVEIVVALLVTQPLWRGTFVGLLNNPFL
mmetsp:Transcript_20923/g.35046  ORF Transcript_20923/g.35046 Transcript_20923/m.35046 type:complete len:201 (-) Transcript_20923:155-757(-)